MQKIDENSEMRANSLMEKGKPLIEILKLTNSY